MTVSFPEWLSESISHLRSGNRSLAARMARPVYYLYLACFFSITRWFPYGTNVYDREWDALLILDTCRVDAMREVADEYEFIDSVESMTSVGSTSFEWMNNTFRNKYIEEVRNTAYVTQNPLVDSVLREGNYTGKVPMPFGPSDWDVVDREDFGYLKELWRADFEDSSDRVLKSDVSTRVHPRYTTDQAIAAGREVDTDRLMLHYIYPHDPYVLSDEKLQPNFDTAIKNGTATRQEAWEAYLDHLRFVLDEVELFLENFDGEVAITADHGEAFGEYGFYRHPPGCPIPCVREVPWVEASAEDTGEYKPTAPDPKEVTASASVESRLEQLGYRT